MIEYIVGGVVLGFLVPIVVLWAKYDAKSTGLSVAAAVLGLFAWGLFVAKSGTYGGGYALAAVVELGVGFLFAFRLYLDEISGSKNF